MHPPIDEVFLLCLKQILTVGRRCPGNQTLPHRRIDWEKNSPWPQDNHILFRYFRPWNGAVLRCMLVRLLHLTRGRHATRAPDSSTHVPQSLLSLKKTRSPPAPESIEMHRHMQRGDTDRAQPIGCPNSKTIHQPVGDIRKRNPKRID